MDTLANLWSDLPLVDWGVELPVDWTKDQSETSEGNVSAKEAQMLECPKCGHEFQL